ncbi:MAG: NAD-dependent epimerase/dehydratase family protein [Thermoguttaceae bacterium]|nr:NAD-dependent epimerase/dehydratase family protein [Thermoguttaceae bacterium]
MKVLVTGSGGFLGKNLCVQLENIRLGKARHPLVSPDLELFRYDIDTPPELLENYARTADFVFHLAGVNRPTDPADYMKVNRDLTDRLLDLLERSASHAPVMISSSIQAELDNPYGASKRAGEELMFDYARRTGAPVYVYRFPNLFGKWSRPNYNSAVATFCHHIASDLPITVRDPAATLTLAYIDDVVDELLRALAGKPTRSGGYCAVPVVHRATLGEITAALYSFKESRATRTVPDLSDPFTAKLYATYLSFLPTDAFAYPLKMNVDERGSFTEMIRTADRGQVSVNISKPHITKGNHWHHTKNEKFLVVSGTGVIRFRPIDSNEVTEYYVGGDDLRVVDIPPGYTHNIENLGESDMVTVMWASEPFDPEKPDTFFLPVQPEKPTETPK